MSCACSPKREQRYLLITSHSVLLVEPDLYRMDYAIVHHSASVLQIKSAVHNFDSCRLHIEAKPDMSACAGLPKACWSTVLIFNTQDQCMAALQALSSARIDLLQARVDAVSNLLEVTSQ